MTVFLNLLPMLASAAAVMALAFNAYIFITLRRDRERLTLELAQLSETAAGRDESLANDLAGAVTRIEQLEQKKPSVWDWMPEPTSVNLNRRGHILRLLRRGDSPAEIASALGLSRGEVMLIVKVHELSRSSES